MPKKEERESGCEKGFRTGFASFAAFGVAFEVTFRGGTIIMVVADSRSSLVLAPWGQWRLRLPRLPTTKGRGERRGLGGIIIIMLFKTVIIILKKSKIG